MYKTTVLLSLALSFAPLAKANAREPHKDWIQFLKGQWTYQYSVVGEDSGELKGEVRYRAASGGNALVARGSRGSNKWTELIGWRADAKMMVFVGYGSNNDNYWHAEYDELRSDRLGGTLTGILPDGRVSETGTVVMEKVNDNEFEVHIKAKVGDEEIVDVGTFRLAACGKRDAISSSRTAGGHGTGSQWGRPR